MVERFLHGNNHRVEYKITCYISLHDYVSIVVYSLYHQIHVYRFFIYIHYKNAMHSTYFTPLFIVLSLSHHYIDYWLSIHRFTTVYIFDSLTRPINDLLNSFLFHRFDIMTIRFFFTFAFGI